MSASVILVVRLTFPSNFTFMTVRIGSLAPSTRYVYRYVSALTTHGLGLNALYEFNGYFLLL